MRFVLTRLAVLIGSTVLVSNVSHAVSGASPLGQWTVHDKSARVLIQNCGPNLCGNLSWTADGNEVGQQILINMKPEGARWTGTVVDIRNGRRYLAHIALQSDQALRLDGCVLGGLICDGEVWTRFNDPVPVARRK